MTNLETLPLRRDDHLRAVVETPARSAMKLHYDAEDGTFSLAKPLPLGLVYPYDWGFFPSTVADDGDPLDAMILGDGPTAAGVVIACRAVGVLHLTERAKKSGRERNDRILAVAMASNRFSDVDDARDLPRSTKRELEEFFLHTCALGRKQVAIEGWSGPKAALRAIGAAHREFSAA